MIAIDLNRRFFCFGAAATLILPKHKSFFIIEPPKLIKPQGLILPDSKLFDLPDFYAAELGRKLVDGIYQIADIPRWVVLDQVWYDQMIAKDKNRA
jgi:hypothetical protein